jgi:hypothetical protein
MPKRNALDVARILLEKAGHDEALVRDSAPRRPAPSPTPQLDQLL